VRGRGHRAGWISTPAQLATPIQPRAQTKADAGPHPAPKLQHPPLDLPAQGMV